MAFNPPTYRPGDALPARDLNEANREIARLGQVRGSAGTVVRRGAGGLQVAVLERETIYARLTGPANGDGGYPWREVYFGDTGAVVLADRTGDDDVDPAYEIRGRTDLAAGDAVYELKRAVTTGEWLFRSLRNCT